MSIFLDMSIDRFSLCIFDGKAKVRRVIILFLAQLKIDVHFLQLCKEIIDYISIVDLCDLFLSFKGHDEVVELLYHEKLLKNRVHVTDAA